MLSRARNLANLLGGGEVAVPATKIADIPASKLSDEISTIEQVSDIDALSATGNTVGDQRIVGNNLYIWNGSGWFRIALINETPTWDSGGQPFSEYTLSAGTPLIVTLAATDPDGFNINYSYVTGGSMDSIATISQDSSVFTITPLSADSTAGGQGTITFRASDGVNILPQISSFSLSFTGDWTTNVSAHSAILNNGTEYNDYVSLDAEGDRISICDYENTVRIYTRSGNSWTLEQDVTPRAGWDVLWDLGYGSGARLSDAGDLFCYGGRGYPQATVDIYRRTGTTWSFEQSLPNGREVSPIVSRDSTRVMYRDGGFRIYKWDGSTWSLEQQLSDNSAQNTLGVYGKDINTDSSILALSVATDNKVNIYTRSGSTWSLSETITLPSGWTSAGGYSGVLFGHVVSISGNGLTLAIRMYKETDSTAEHGRVFVYTRTSTSNNFGNTPAFNYDRNNAAVYNANDANFGRTVEVDDTGTRILMSANTANYIAQYDGSSWSLNQFNLNTQNPVAPSSGLSYQAGGGASSLSRGNAKFMTRGANGTQIFQAG